VKSRLGVILVTLLAITAISVAMGYAGRGEGTGRGDGRGHGGFFDQLTEQQRAALHEKVEEMKGAGASREEINAAVREMLAGWGIDLPEHRDRGEGVRDGRPEGHPRFLDQLTEEQRTALREKVEEMKAAGASHEQIRDAVHEMLTGWGVDVPREPREPRGPRGEVFKQLTDEQRQAIHEKIREMREAGASREDIHATVREMLEGYGIELPEGVQGGPSPETLESENAQSASWGGIKASFK
jgi:DNA-binding transcriptional regulator YhcF (GntR family)